MYSVHILHRLLNWNTFLTTKWQVENVSNIGHKNLYQRDESNYVASSLGEHQTDDSVQHSEAHYAVDVKVSELDLQWWSILATCLSMFYSIKSVSWIIICA